MKKAAYMDRVGMRMVELAHKLGVTKQDNVNNLKTELEKINNYY